MNKLFFMKQNKNKIVPRVYRISRMIVNGYVKVKKKKKSLNNYGKNMNKFTDF